MGTISATKESSYSFSLAGQRLDLRLTCAWYWSRNRDLWSGRRILWRNCLCSSFRGRANPL